MIFFEDVYHPDYFTRNATALSRATRQRFAFPSLHQLGIVVPEVERAALDLENRGLGPFFIAEGVIASSWKMHAQVQHKPGPWGLEA